MTRVSASVSVSSSINPPANVHMALNADDFPRVPGGAKALWGRLPVQGLFIAWVLGAMRQE